MCAPGGHVVVVTLQGRMRRFEADIGHVRNYAPGELAEKMRGAGLEIDRSIAWGFPFYSPLYRDLLEMLGNRGTMGRFGLVRKPPSPMVICYAGVPAQQRAVRRLYLRARAQSLAQALRRKSAA